MLQTVVALEAVNLILFLSLNLSIFEFVSYFDIRISKFGKGYHVKHALYKWFYFRFNKPAAALSTSQSNLPWVGSISCEG